MHLKLAIADCSEIPALVPVYSVAFWFILVQVFWFILVQVFWYGRDHPTVH